MPSDLLTYKILAKELDDLLRNGKVQKINQPERDEVRFSIYNDCNYTLVISYNPSAPRIHIADDKKDNPYTPPALCMLLRKYLTGATVTGIGIFNDDRIFKIDFLGKTELMDARRYIMYCELMGRYSNLVFCDENNKVLDCAVRLGFEAKAKRSLMPGLTYSAPEKGGKAELYEYEKIKNSLTETSEDNAVGALLKSVNGLSKQSAAEIIMRADAPYPFDKNGAIKIAEQITFFNDIYKSSAFIPCVLPDYSDYFVTPYLSLNTADQYKKYPSLNGAVNACYILADKKIRIDSYSKNILNLTKRHRDKLKKKIKFAEVKSAECADMESVRINAELISANIYKIKRGDKSVTVQNYYDEMRDKTIPLDVSKSPQQNAAALYNKFNKLKRAKVITEQQLADYKRELDYTLSILEELSRADMADINDIKEELVQLKIIKKPQLKRGEKKPARAMPKSYEVDGHTIIFGTNNVQNNEVTFKIGRSFDIWMHIKNHHGCHLIIKKNDENEVISDNILLSAAETAAYYSEAKNGENTAVDYTDRKFVRRIKNAGPGMVTYDNYMTVFVTPKDNSK